MALDTAARNQRRTLCVAIGERSHACFGWTHLRANQKMQCAMPIRDMARHHPTLIASNS